MQTDILKKIYLFSGLNEDELNMLKNITHIKKFNKGDIIFFDTEPYRGFYIVLEGLVKIYKISKDGREHILHIIEPNNTFAEVPLFENLDIQDNRKTDDSFRYPANSMALEDSTEVALIPANTFKTLLEKNSSICMKMLSGFSKRLRHLNRHIEELTLMDVTRRTANFIYAEYINKRKSKTDPKKDSKKDAQPFITLNISKNDLASYLGTIIETLSRTFKKLQDEGLIEVEGKKIIIKDTEKLKKLTL
jgi:CRP/FNR family transcriptional regulator, dissimilatory nitrate respiration regulator